MGKNIVVCCDGTNNSMEGPLTNIVRIFEITLIAGSCEATGADVQVPDPRPSSRRSRGWTGLRSPARVEHAPAVPSARAEGGRDETEWAIAGLSRSGASGLRLVPEGIAPREAAKTAEIGVRGA